MTDSKLLGNMKCQKHSPDEDVICVKKRGSVKQSHRRSSYETKLEFFSLGLIVMCITLLCWNLHLYSELNKVRQDVDLLLSAVRTINKNNDDVAWYQDEMSKTESRVPSSDSSSEVSALGRRFLELNEGSNSTTSEERRPDKVRFLVKRSAGTPPSSPPNRSPKQKKNGRRPPRDPIAYLYKRRRKAVAIHVKARSDQPNNFISRFNVPVVAGKALKNWELPDQRRYIGFDTSNLTSQGFIRVKTKGFYFVYSQVIFLLTDLPHLVSEIGVKTNGQMTFTKCQFTAPLPSQRGSSTSGRNRYAACHSNGVVYLQKGEGISLSVHPARVEVYMRREYTYFGAFLVGF